MALARETLSGPFPFRGLHDFPERADYGNASQARNVDFGDGWMRPRLGTDRVGRVVNIFGTPNASDELYTVDLVRYFEAEGASFFATVGGRPGGPGSLGPAMRLCVDVPGNVVSAPMYSVESLDCNMQRPTSCEWSVSTPKRLIVFMPLASYPDSIPLLIDSTTPYVRTLIPSGTVTGTSDEGAYRTAGDQVFASWGVVHQGRLVVGGLEGKVWYSSVADPYAWPVLNEINEFGGKPLTGAASYNGELVVFTAHSSYVVTLDGQQNLKTRKLLHSTGCVHHNTIVEAARQLIWLSEDGLVGLDASGNVTEISKNIQRTLRSYASDFPNASLIHYAARRQLWLLLPGPRRIFVLDLRTGDWSTHDWGANDVNPGSICLAPFAGIERPVVGARMPDDAGRWHGQLLAFDQQVDGDWITPSGARYPVEASWQSLPIMSLGHHTPRVFRHWRIVGRDVGSLATNTFYWLTEGQTGVGTPEVAGQSVLGSFVARYVARRWGDVVVWWNTVGAYWPNDAGVLDVAVRYSLAGTHTGRWIQLGVRKTSVFGTFALRSFELDTRRFEGRR